MSVRKATKEISKRIEWKMNKYNKNQFVIFKIGNLILSGLIINIMNIQNWTKDQSGNSVKVDGYQYFVNTIVGGSDVKEEDIIGIKFIYSWHR